MTKDTRASQVEKNFEAFKALLPELMLHHQGKFAVMHDGEVVEFFDTVGDAARFGREKFGDVFSIQEVTSRDVNLGFYTYAMQHVSP